MKKTNFFMAIGTLVLATAAFVAAKPAKKITLSSAVAGGVGKFAGYTVIGAFTTSQNNGSVSLVTKNGGTRATLFSRTSGTAKVYLQ